MKILEARSLVKEFESSGVKAVNDVSLTISSGETLGVFGESGSGKSTLGKLLLGLVPSDRGEVLFKDRNVKNFTPAEWKEFRSRIQVVFQHPVLSLNPRMTVREILREPFLIHTGRGKAPSDGKIANILKNVELPGEFLKKLPRQMSGGECQRVAIARALCMEPELIVCDEPVSSLDVIVQAQVLNLFLKLQKEKNISYLFISHDLRVVRHMSDRVMVMKEGGVCESGSRDQVFGSPQNAYTRSLVEKLM